jgi:hypothetical protein
MNTISTQETKWTGTTLSAFMLTLVAFLLSTGFVNAQTYSGPLVITKGGTYTGNWESKDSEVAAVDIRTSEPVIIVNSNIRGAGYLIKSWGHAANITVRHTKGYGLTPTPWRDYKKPRRFLTVNNFKNVVVENCYMEGTAGIYVGTRYEGNGSTSETVKIRYNKAKNIDGRVHGSAEHSQFAQFNFRGNLPHAEIAWNEIINEPNRSLVEDNINLSNSRGTSGSPIRIHNNYIQGAYPIPATETKFSGGGIISDSWYQDGMGDPALVATAYVKVHDNQTVNIGNYNYAIAGGNNIEVYNNRGINSGLFDDGTRMNTHNVGLYGYDYYKKGATFNAVMRNNVTGVMSQGNLFDKNYFPDGLVKNENNPYVGGNITKQHEKDEYTAWLAKLSRNGIALGPNGSAPTASPTTTEPVATDPVATTEPAPTTSISGTTSTVTGTGKITRDFWSNVHGSTISVVPVNTTPASTSMLSLFEAPSGQGNNYGQRIRGYVTAPASGQYTFWIAADDIAELYLSTSEDPARKTRIALSSTWTNPREWNKTSGQQSAKITLEAGKRYYIEAVMLQGGGGDNLAVGWQLPNGTMERPIAGNRLSPVDQLLASSTSALQADTNDSDISFDKVTAYPNPFSDVVTLDLGKEDIKLQEVVILDQTGTVVYKEENLKVENGKLVMNLASTNLRTGLYFLKYTDSNGKSSTIKLVKE